MRTLYTDSLEPIFAERPCEKAPKPITSLGQLNYTEWRERNDRVEFLYIQWFTSPAD